MLSSTTLSERARVLLVDDNEGMLARAASALSPDYEIVGSVKSGQAALKAAIAIQPDAIVMDISMPGMNGLEAAANLRAAGSTAALVFLTVHDEEDFITAARAVGAIGYVVKPRLASDLSVAVREALAGRPFVSPLR
jgi:DNA-binding NarL/FixJ family response regulator